MANVDAHLRIQMRLTHGAHEVSIEPRFWHAQYGPRIAMTASDWKDPPVKRRFDTDALQFFIGT